MEGRSVSNDRALHRSHKRRVTTFYSLLLYLPIITFVTMNLSRCCGIRLTSQKENFHCIIYYE